MRARRHRLAGARRCSTHPVCSSSSSIVLAVVAAWRGRSPCRPPARWPSCSSRSPASRRSTPPRSPRCAPNSTRSPTRSRSSSSTPCCPERQSLINVLQRRLDAGELTYARYLSTSQQVFSSALDNLHEIAVAYESISTIDETYIDRRLAELDCRRQRRRVGRTRARHPRTTTRPAHDAAAQDRPAPRPERVGAHCTRPHDHRAGRRPDRQATRGRRRGDGRTRGTRRPSGQVRLTPTARKAHIHERQRTGDERPRHRPCST